MHTTETQMSGDDLRTAAAKTTDGDKAAARRAKAELKRRAKNRKAKAAARLTPTTPIKAKTTRTPAYKAAMTEAKRTAQRQAEVAGGGFVKLHIAARAAATANLMVADLALIPVEAAA